ncbi:MAG: adenylosuccinate lyase, partial [Oligella ureolytica]|nr:adenylosuccinate lyase [Oligella ureolytica]
MKIADQLTTLNALSPIDGRYASRTDALRPFLSEAAYMAHRVEVEIEWLKALAGAGLPELKPFDESAIAVLDSLVTNFTEDCAVRIKEIEKITNHDVKAVEYFLKEKVADHQTLSEAAEFIHFACTSEDINNTSHALMLSRARDQVVLPKLKEVLAKMVEFAHQFAEQPMLSRTHGQPASPSTMGKEFANFAARLQRA